MTEPKKLNFTNEQIVEISQQLECWFRSFYHKLKGTLIFVPDTSKFFDMETDAWEAELKELKKQAAIPGNL